MMVKSALEKIFLKFLHALTITTHHVISITEFGLLIIIFRPKMLKFHPYSILTGDTMVGFVILCVLRE